MKLTYSKNVKSLTEMLECSQREVSRLSGELQRLASEAYSLKCQLGNATSEGVKAKALLDEATALAWRLASAWAREPHGGGRP